MSYVQTWKAEMWYQLELILGEGPCWHPGWDALLFVDIDGKKLGCIDLLSLKLKLISLPERVSMVVPAADNKLVVALQGSIAELDFNTGELQTLSLMEENIPSNRCNEGKCDAAGRLWIGTMDENAALHKGALYCYNGKLNKKLSNISISNGICWNKNNTTMYYIDSFEYNIKAYDFEIRSGNISNERIIITVKGKGLTPDGMTIDNEGMLWVAMWGGGCVHRYNPLNGELTGKVFVEAPNVSSCAFGGDNMQQLFITTARTGLTTEQLKQYPLSGSLFIVNTGISGCATNFFTAKSVSPLQLPGLNTI